MGVFKNISIELEELSAKSDEELFRILFEQPEGVVSSRYDTRALIASVLAARGKKIPNN